MIKVPVRYLLWVGLFLVCWACTSETPTNETETTTENKDFTVNIYLKGAPAGLNVLTATNGYANTILDQNVHASLLEINHNNFDEYFPYLAVARPEIGTSEDGRATLTYEIRPEANWSNGTPITGEDVAFTLKAIITPLVNEAPLRTFFEFFDESTIDHNNP